MDSALATVGLPIALAVIMLGLGLDLTVADFRRVTRHPRAAVIALTLQLLVLPVFCFGLVLALQLPPILAVGMMLLAASPGGTTAALFSHLFRGDVALNISLTAINSAIAFLTLPLITGLAIGWFGLSGEVSLPLGEVLSVFAIVLVPVLLGMLVRARRPEFARRMDRPVRIGSALVLAALVLGILVDQREDVVDYIAAVGLAAVIFCATNLVLGYVVPRALGVGTPQAIASSMEIGVHNGTLAIYVAVEVLGSTQASVPAAVYSVFMFVLAALWGSLLVRRTGAARPVPA